jgi:hypothetical protein
MKEPHFPPTFGQTDKPHICRIEGLWYVVWPIHVPVTPAMCFPFWVNRLNGFLQPRPDSIVYNEWRTPQ